MLVSPLPPVGELSEGSPVKLGSGVYSAVVTRRTLRTYSQSAMRRRLVCMEILFQHMARSRASWSTSIRLWTGHTWSCLQRMSGQGLGTTALRYRRYGWSPTCPLRSVTHGHMDN